LLFVVDLASSATRSRLLTSLARVPLAESCDLTANKKLKTEDLTPT
jgi:hypothetical protein